MRLNPELVKMARKNVGRQKVAFQPPGGDPAAMGGDPAAMGGAPPMDPAMAGGAPPMDPAAMAGAMPPPVDPAAGGAMAGDPAIGAKLDQLIQLMSQQGGAGAAGAGGPGAAAGKMAKPDINTVAIDIFQVKKMLQYLFKTMEIELPPDILDGPNRDPATGAPMMPGAPGSTSDPSMAAAAPPAGGGGGGGPDSAIKPIGPMQGAFPAGGGGGGEKTGAARVGTPVARDNSVESTPIVGTQIRNKAAAIGAVLRRKTRN